MRGIEQPGRITFVTVARDLDMYDQLVRSNRNCGGAEFVVFDNRNDNQPIPVRYNSFLDTYDYSHEGWFVFCHEDYEFLEPLAPALSRLDRHCLYGQVGAIRRGLAGFGMQTIAGNLFCRPRDGSEPMRELGLRIKKLRRVETFDCCCIIFHSSLVKETGLRFDEKLEFDFYVEDFCAAAFVNFGVKSYLIPIKACHHSNSIATNRLTRHLPYLEAKYPHNCFVTTLTYFGTLDWKKRLQDWGMSLLGLR